MRYFIVYLLLLCSSFLHAQLHDYNWMMGYSGGEGTDTTNEFGLTRIKFEEESIQVLDQQSQGDAFFWPNNISFSDHSGELFCYSNGEAVYNRLNEVMEGGEDWHEEEHPLGWRSPQLALILPFFNSDSIYAFINSATNSFPGLTPNSNSAGEGILFSIIDQTENNGLGKVILRKEEISQDTLDFGKLSACRHANGRDWWVIVARYTLNEFHRFLLTPNGLEWVGTQQIGEGGILGLGQAFFTPDGNKH